MIQKTDGAHCLCTESHVDNCNTIQRLFIILETSVSSTSADFNRMKRFTEVWQVIASDHGIKNEKY